MSEQSFVLSVFGERSVTVTGYVRAEFCCISFWGTECYCDGLCQSRVLFYQFVENRFLLKLVISEERFALSVFGEHSVSVTGYVRAEFCFINRLSINSICSFICHLANGQLAYQSRS